MAGLFIYFEAHALTTNPFVAHNQENIDHKQFRGLGVSA